MDNVATEEIDRKKYSDKMSNNEVWHTKCIYDSGFIDGGESIKTEINNFKTYYYERKTII